MKWYIFLLLPLLLFSWDTEGDGSGSATISVAASNSSQASKNRADYISPTTALQTAFDALSDSGGLFFMYEGDYEDSIKVNGKKYVTIKGSGWATRLKTPDSTNTTPIMVINSEFVKIADLQIDGNMFSFCDTVSGTPDTVHFDTTAGEFVQSALSCSATTNLNIENVYCHDAVYMGVQVWSCSSYTIEKSIFNRNRIKGISTIWGENGLIEGNTIDSNGIEMLDTSVVVSRGTGHDGIMLHYQEYKTKVIDNTVRWNQRSNIQSSSVEGTIANNRCHGAINGPGIYAGQYGSAVINGNMCTGNKSYGIVVHQNAVGAVVSNNVCEENEMEGILIEEENHIVIGNTCRRNNAKGIDSLYAGIELKNATHCYVVNNKCFDDDTPIKQAYGIWESGTSDSNIIAYNDVRQNHFGGIGLVGAATRVYMNEGHKFDIKPGVIISNMLVGALSAQSYLGVNKNSTGYIYNGLTSPMSADSLTLDSMKVVYYSQADSNYITAIDIDIFTNLATKPTTQIWVDNTDTGVDSTSYFAYKYSAMGLKIAPWDLFRIGVTGASMAVNIDIRVYNCVWFMSY